MQRRGVFRFFLSVILVSISATNLHSQIGIGTTTPDADALLDITSSATKPGGLLLPRVVLTSLTSPAPLTEHVEGMTVYHTGTATIGEGLYYNDGVKWIKSGGSAQPTDEFWATEGNTGTNPNNHYIGTRDNKDFWIRTDGTKRFVFTTQGEIRATNKGTEAAPTYSWAGPDNESTGIFLPEDKNMGFTTDGVERFRIPNANQVYAMADGTETRPFYSWGQSPGTGIYKPVENGVDNLGFSVAENETFRMTPEQLLSMRQPGAFPNHPDYSWDKSNNTGMLMPVQDEIGFKTNNTERFRIPNAYQVYAMATGSKTLPFYSWEAEPGTGMWRSSSSPTGLGFSVDGKDQFRMTTDGQLLRMESTGVNTPSRPAYSWDAAKTTGMFLNDGPSIGFSIGASERLRITDNQLLGFSSGTVSAPYFSWKDAPSTGIFRQSGSANHFLGFTIDGTEKFQINKDGQLLQMDTSQQSATIPTYSWANAPNTGIFTPSPDAIGLTTEGVERLRIPSNGQLYAMGPGTEDLPFYSWIGTEGTGIYRPTDNGGNNIGFSTSGTERMRLNYKGHLLINKKISTEEAWLQVYTSNASETAIRAKTIANGTAIHGEVTPGNPGAWAGYFVGDVQYTGTLSGPSDRRFKRDIQPLDATETLAKVKQVVPSSYQWNSQDFPEFSWRGNQRSFGFIAQDFKELYPELVQYKRHPGKGTANNEYYSINYIEFIPILTKTIQEQQEIIDQQEARIQRLEAQLELLLQD